MIVSLILQMHLLIFSSPTHLFQVINISLGIGLPAIFVCLSGGEGGRGRGRGGRQDDSKIHISAERIETLRLLMSLLSIVIVTYIVVTLPLLNLIR